MTTNLSADLKAIHKAGAGHLADAAAVYESMVDMTKTLESATEQILATAMPVSDRVELLRGGNTFGYWSDALAALRLVFTEAGRNMSDAGDILRLIAYEYAETDDEAAANLQKATGFEDGFPTLVYGEWR